MSAIKFRGSERDETENMKLMKLNENILLYLIKNYCKSALNDVKIKLSNMQQPRIEIISFEI